MRFTTLLLLFAATLAAAPPPPAPAANGARQRIGAAAQRNENVAVFQIDNNAIKEANVRVGTTATAVAEPLAESNYFAAEHGRPAAEQLMLRAAPPAAAWHGELFWWHQNSVFNARTFFQVGGVKPSHRNHYGGRATGKLPRLGLLTVTAFQRKINGMVNGNVLVPLQNERTPLTTDPADRALVERYFRAYPNEMPNRPDFDPRALNTNAPQRINEVDGSARLDVKTGKDGRLALFQSLNRQRVDAFQFVAGMNPDTELHSLRSRLSWTKSWGANTELWLGGQFQRVRTALLPEPNAVGPRVRFGYQIEELGPDNQFPINRAANTFRYGAQVARRLAGGRHTLTAGGDLARFRLNGIESSNARGVMWFTSNWGKTSIENLRWGRPTMYEATVGELARGYRNWTVNGFFADRWRAHARLQIYLGVRYTADTRPVEVRNQETIPYASDRNNFSPRVGLAWQAGRGWVARAMYTTSFGQILPVTYQQIRNSPPGVYYVMVQEPKLAAPLAGINLSDPHLRNSPTFFSADLATPYAHQYNATLEHKWVAGSTLRLAYIGSRTVKSLNMFIQNRAEAVPGIPLTTATVDLRRPDPRYYEVKWVVNAGNAFFDAGQVNWELPVRRGLAAGVTYTFSKALDEGVDFSATAANMDVSKGRSQYQYDSLRDRRGLSNFDSPHAWQAHYSYDLPVPAAVHGWRRAALRDWQISGVTMWKMGTPLTLYIGSDGPGFGNVDGGPGDRPNIVDASILGKTIGDPNTATQILRRGRFSFLAPGQHAGTLGRGTFRKSHIWNWNAAVTRQWRAAGRHEWTAQFRAEIYNATNTPQFDEPQRNLSSPSFGRITNTLNDGRVMQVGVRLML